MLVAFFFLFGNSYSTLPDLSGGFQHGASAAIGRFGGATSYRDLAKGAALASRQTGVTTHLSAKRAARKNTGPGPVRAHLSQEMGVHLSEEMKAAARKAPKAGFLSRISSGMYNLMPRRARGMLDRYFIGLKKLFRDFSDAFMLWRSQRKLKQAQRRGPVRLEANTEAMLTWKERTLLRRMPIDFVRMLPIACNPIPPPFGLAIPLIACLFPRVLLTHQFYSEDEAACYAWDEHLRRHRVKRDVLIHLLQKVANYNAADPFGAAGASNGVTDGSEAVDVEGDAVQLLTNTFGDKAGKARIDSLSREHVCHLLDTWIGGSASVSRKLRLMQRYPFRLFVPTPLLRRGLEAIADEIAADDEFLAASDFDSLTTDELEYACQCRGITPSLLYLGSMRREALKRRLEGYLRVREKIESSASVKEGRRRDVQRSLILHLPALMPEHVS